MMVLFILFQIHLFFPQFLSDFMNVITILSIVLTVFQMLKWIVSMCYNVQNNTIDAKLKNISYEIAIVDLETRRINLECRIKEYALDEKLILFVLH